MRTLTTLILLFAFSSTLFANGLVISNVQRQATPNEDLVQFDIAWQNSWMVSGNPGNHDAVWVFIKYKPCNSTQPQASHALLSTTMSDHTFSSGVQAARDITDEDRFGNPGDHNTGVLVRRSSPGVGNITSETVTLRIVGGTDGSTFDATEDYNIEVFGVEMVQVVEGGHTVGGDATLAAPALSGSYDQNMTINNYVVSSETQTTTISTGMSWNASMTANFPKGYDEFYVMKYEISQGQYADFLNNIGAFASNRASTPYGTNRYAINLGGTGYVADDPNRACNYLSPADIVAYCDWATLRPMTELEWEKAARGGAYQDGGFAFGNNANLELITVGTPEDGTELSVTTDANLHYEGTQLNVEDVGANDLGNGPVGCGIFARDGNEDRVTAGASYWGAMEMSGNVSELCISVYPFEYE